MTSNGRVRRTTKAGLSGARLRTVPPPPSTPAPRSGPSPSPLSQLSPGDLGERLDRWALRREKVLAVIDVRAARQARRLAVACRALANRLDQAQASEREALALEWLELRAEVAALLAPASSPPLSRPRGPRSR